MTSINSALPAEIRKDYLLNRWVIFAPSRASRPEVLTQDIDVEYNPEANPFCAGHEAQTPGELYAIADQPREKNTPGWQVRVFPNAYPALNKAGTPQHSIEAFFNSVSGVGRHELIVDCPQFEADFGKLSPAQIAKVLTAYRDRMQAAYVLPEVKYVQVFKNQGSAAGASLPHAHSQLLTFPLLPPLLQDELQGCIDFSKEHHGERFFPWLVSTELELNQRVILNTTDFMVLAPYASRFSYEAWIIPHRHAFDYTSINQFEIHQLAEVLSQVLCKLGQLINPPSYNLVLHSLPPNTLHAEEYCWHLEILPRITGLAGFEMGTGCYVNAVFPEQAAVQYALK